MKLTAEHKQLRETIARWIEKDVNPYTEEWEKARIFPAHQVFKQMGDLGLLGLNKPEAFGGSGLDYSYAAVLAEGLGDIQSGGVAMGIGVQTDMCTPALAKHGSDELREEFLRPAIAGDYVGCIGVSEVSGGSDVAAIKTSARKDGDDYIINGGKMWITNSTQADFCVLLVNTSEGDVHRNKTLVVVPMKTKGIEIARKIEKIGMHASDTAQLYFDDVRVPQRNRIGEEGKGFIYQMEQFQYERAWSAVKTANGLQKIIDMTVKYTQERKVFGRSLSDNQWVNFKLAEYQAETDALKALAWKCVEKIVDGGDATRLATSAKFKSGKLAREIPDGCLQFWGGMGYAAESPMSRAYCDMRLAAIGGGADEVMLQILTKFMGTHPKN